MQRRLQQLVLCHSAVVVVVVLVVKMSCGAGERADIRGEVSVTDAGKERLKQEATLLGIISRRARVARSLLAMKMALAN